MAALAYTTPCVDDEPRPPRKETDRWALLILGWSQISQPLALYAYRARRAGEDFDVFTDRFLMVVEGSY